MDEVVRGLRAHPCCLLVGHAGANRACALQALVANLLRKEKFASACVFTDCSQDLEALSLYLNLDLDLEKRPKVHQEEDLDLEFKKVHDKIRTRPDGKEKEKEKENVMVIVDAGRFQGSKAFWDLAINGAASRVTFIATLASNVELRTGLAVNADLVLIAHDEDRHERERAWRRFLAFFASFDAFDETWSKQKNFFLIRRRFEMSVQFKDFAPDFLDPRQFWHAREAKTLAIRAILTNSLRFPKVLVDHIESFGLLPDLELLPIFFSSHNPS